MKRFTIYYAAKGRRLSRWLTEARCIAEANDKFKTQFHHLYVILCTLPL